MRPIKLKIKGLNSFIEEQTVDFEKLTDRGLFGIFGKTGSGKSTILDGITLALYGDVSRKSSNYINTNCDKLNVSFEFQISGAETKRYLVNREFKRDKKTGNPVSGKCKMVDITNGEEVLADKVKTVTDKCKEVIGLSLEDFSRTVVLPQGKFSEFLKLEGKPRREMLERLFNLEEYGDKLSIKLSKEINKERTENSVLLGQLKGYEDISEEKKREKEEELNSSIKKLESINKELESIEKEYKENHKLWEMQLEFNEYKNRENELVKKAEKIEVFKEKVKTAESASKVNPFIIAYEETLKNIDLTENKLRKVKVKCEELKGKKIKWEEAWNKALINKNTYLPNYKIQEEKIKEAIEDKNNLIVLENEIGNINYNIENLDKKKIKNEEDLKDCEERLKRGNGLLKEKEDYRETLNISRELKEDVQEGLNITRDYEEVYKSVKDYKIKLEENEKVLKKLLEEKKILKINLEEKKDLLKKCESGLSNLIESCPETQDDLFNLQEKYTGLNGKLDIFKRSKENILKNKSLIKDLDENLNIKKESYINLENDLKKLKDEFIKVERENLAHKLREELKDGDICPVCGSLNHNKENIKGIKVLDISNLENSITLKESQLNELYTNIKEIEVKIISLRESVKENESEIKNLGEDFNEEEVLNIQFKISNLRNKLKKYAFKKEEYEKELNSLREENNALNINYVKLETKIKSIEDLIEETKIEKKEADKKLEDVEKSLLSLKEKTNIKDFKIKSEEINKIEHEREEVDKTIKNYRNRLEELSNKRDNSIKSLNETNQELIKVTTFLENKIKNRDEILIRIKDKVSDINNIEEILKNIQIEIRKIEANYILSEKEKNEANKDYEECNLELISIASKSKELYKRKDEEKQKLELALKEENFLNTEEVKFNILEKEKIEELKIEIESYNDNLSKVKGAIESISKKIGDRSLSEEKWISIQNKKEEKEIEFKEINEIKIKLQGELNIIKEKMEELKGLWDKKEKLDHKLALLNDLDKLFKGKKFVEFVATTRLKYVSLEASKKLKEITNGNYGLEVDENGKFIIRDYKNGGAKRDASTLSGGEIFLASLALALALSAEIQLKGTAPLELFFLDEGFGTLDDNLLEVVMSSLERIHNDKLKIGIISHVESIKNRVPVKLLITPAEAGMGGSKVKIERS